jgi:hypothetical protein
MPTVTAPTTPPRHSPTPYKRRAPPPATPAPFPLALMLSLTLFRSRVMVESPPIFIVAALLHRHRACSDELPIGVVSSPPFSLAIVGEIRSLVAPDMPHAGDALQYRDQRIMAQQAHSLNFRSVGFEGGCLVSSFLGYICSCFSAVFSAENLKLGINDKFFNWFLKC